MNPAKAIARLAQAPSVTDPLAQAACLVAGLADAYVVAALDEQGTGAKALLGKPKHTYFLTQARVLLQGATDFFRRAEQTSDLLEEVFIAEQYLNAVSQRFEEAGGEY
jgi:3-hydroxy-3-methylglutaryl CoA synthase